MNSYNEKQLAAAWKCDVRTIRRWSKAGAPFGNDTKIRAWLSTRKSLPPGTAELLAAKRTEIAAMPASAQPEARTGAGAALVRLECSEAAAYAAFVRAVESGDSVQIKLTRQNWLAISEQLRKFDAQVESNKREDGEVIPRGEMERLLRMVSWSWNNGLHCIVDRICQLWRGKELTELPPNKTREILLGVFAAAVAQGSVQSNPPKWVISAITSGVNVQDAENRVDELFRAFVQAGLDKHLPLSPCDK